jgi:RNA polymerase sigma-70 factor (ECF subfamily)
VVVVRLGDPPAVVGAFFDAAFDAVYSYLARRCVGDGTVAEDLTQETFVTALRSLRSGSVDHVSVGWMISVARSRLIDHYRREAMRSRHLRAVGGEAAADDVADVVVDGEMVGALLDHLPARQRLDIALHHLDGLSVREIAERTDRTERAVESSIARALRVLRALCAGESP